MKRIVTTACLILLLISAYYYADYAGNNRYIENLTVSLSSGPERALIAATNIAYNIPPHMPIPPKYGYRNPLERILGPTAKQIHQQGGHCGRRARLLICILDAVGIDSRKVHLINYNYRSFGHANEYVHAVVEAQIDGRWVVSDPLYNIVYKHPSGKLATIHEIQANDKLMKNNIALAHTDFRKYLPIYTYDETRGFAWCSIPLGDKIFDFASLYFSASRLHGPKFLEYPRLAISAFFFALSSLLLLCYCVFILMQRSSSISDGVVLSTQKS